MRGKILVVDDEPIILRSCERTLSPEGFDVETVTSPIDALKREDLNKFEIIISDLRMPGMDGIEFIKEVRKVNQQAGIIIITGYPSQETLKEAVSLKIVDYLPKPFSPTLLLEVVTNTMEMRQRAAVTDSRPDDYTEEMVQKLDEIIANYKDKPGGLIPVLQEAQELFGYLPPVIQKHIARGLRVPVSEVHGVVSFYSFFTMKPKGKHNIKVCLGTACYVKGAEELLNNLKAGLRIGASGMTEDRKFSVDTVRCLGACGLAPVVVIDKDTHGAIKPVEIMHIVKQYE
jgi:NADH-quinone oxidoreductase subunit E/NADP-reducing hydrogenase subunit HndA